MPDAIYADAKVLLLQMETTYATDPGSWTGASAILATRFELQPMEGQDVNRDLVAPWMGNREMMHGDFWGVMGFEVELAPSGSTGVAPAWGPILRACGCAQVVVADDEPDDGTVTYNPVTAGHESVAMHFHHGPTRHVLLGARGTGVLTYGAQGIPRLRVTLTGLWVQPTAQSMPTPDFSAFERPQIVGNTRTPLFEVDETALVLRQMTVDLGNQVEPRFLVGRHEIIIVDRQETISFTAEATPLSHIDPYDMVADLTLFPIEFQHGTVAGSRLTFGAQSCQLNRPGRSEENQKRIEWPLVARPLPVTGNDQWAVVLS